jgi:CHAT domain-containing protein
MFDFMRVLLIVFVFLFGLIPSFAQDMEDVYGEWEASYTSNEVKRFWINDQYKPSDSLFLVAEAELKNPQSGKESKAMALIHLMYRNTPNTHTFDSLFKMMESLDLPSTNPYTPKAYYLKGLRHVYFQPDIDMAKKYYQLADSMYRLLGEVFLHDQLVLHNDMGIVAYYYENDLAKADFHYQKALKLSRRIKLGYSNALYRLYYNLSALKRMQGITLEALEFAEEILRILEYLPNSNFQQKASAQMLMGNCYTNLYKYDQALKYYVEAERLFVENNIYSDPNIFSLMNNLAAVNIFLKNWETSRQYIEKGLQLVLQAGQKGSSNHLSLINREIDILNRQGYTEKALDLCFQYEDLAGKNYLFRSEWAKVNTQSQQYQLALEQLAIWQSLISKENHEWDKVKVASLEAITDDYIQSTMRRGEYMALWAIDQEVSDQPLWLEEQIQAQILAVDSLIQIRVAQFPHDQTFFSTIEKDKGYFANLFRYFHNQYQKNLDPKYIEHIHFLQERRNSLRMLYELQTHLRLTEEEKDLGIRQKEKELKAEINRLESLVAQTEEEKEQRQLRQQMGKTRQDLLSLNEEYGLNSNIRLLTNNQLPFSPLSTKTDMAVLSFSLDGDMLTVYGNYQEKYSLVQHSWTEKKANLLQEWLDLLQAPTGSVSPAILKKYEKYAYELYETLLSGSLEQLQVPQGKGLMISRNMAFPQFPFEALVSQRHSAPQQFGQLHYLIRDYAISYIHSLSIWDLQQKIRPEAPKGLLAMAYSDPDENLKMSYGNVLALRDKQQYALPGSGLEVAAIHKLLGGTMYTGKNAMKARFLSEAGQYGIIHLAIHGEGLEDNVKEARMIFPNEEQGDQGFLFPHEVYALDLKAQLVVLSACESSLGRQGAEGPESLARAFSMAGVTALVQTLWKVPDISAYQLMPAFYEGLKRGMEKDQALRASKLRYLEEADELTSHPYFWAGYTLMGNNEPIRMQKSYWIEILSASFILLLLLTFWVKRKPTV